MATTTPRKNKNGEIISYQIEVYRGRDMRGKKLKPYSMNWKVPNGWKKSSIQKELTKIAGEFETNCKQGNVSADNQIFEAYSLYVMQIKKRDCKHRTVKRYEELLERINEEIGFLKLTQITAEHLNRFYLKLSEKGQNKKTGGYLEPKTILEYHRLIHTILTEAVKEGIIRFNVADGATPPKHKKKEAEFFEVDEVTQIIKALEDENIKYKTIVRSLIDSGARRGEVLGFEWKLINYTNGTVKIKNTVLYSKEKGVYLDTTKTDENRVITLSKEVLSLLKQLKIYQTEQKLKLGSAWEETGLCFTNEKGLPMHPDTLNSWISRFEKKHNLPHIYPHKFRHTQASLLYSNGIDQVTISKRLGHKKVSTTQDIYAHLMANNDKKASDSIARILYNKEA